MSVLSLINLYTALNKLCSSVIWLKPESERIQDTWRREDFYFGYYLRLLNWLWVSFKFVFQWIFVENSLRCTSVNVTVTLWGCYKVPLINHQFSLCSLAANKQHGQNVRRGILGLLDSAHTVHDGNFTLLLSWCGEYERECLRVFIWCLPVCVNASLTCFLYFLSDWCVFGENVMTLP